MKHSIFCIHIYDLIIVDMEPTIIIQLVGVHMFSSLSVLCQYEWEFQDPKTEVLYHIRPYFVGIFPYIGLI